MDRTELKHTIGCIKEFKSKKYSRDSVAQYWLVTKDDKKTDYGNQCTSGLRDSGVENNISIINQLQSLKVEEDVGRRYLEWLIHFSIYRDCFITRNVRKLLSNRIMVMNVDSDRDLLGSALQAVRLITEFNNGNVWDHLVRNGLHPDAAFAVAHNYLSNNQTMWIGAANTNHFAIPIVHKYNYPIVDASLVDYAFWNFFERKPRLTGLSYRTNPGWSGTWHIWKDYNIKKQSYYPLLNLSNVKQTTVAETNPFNVNVSVVGATPLEAGCEYLADVVGNLIRNNAGELHEAA